MDQSQFLFIQQGIIGVVVPLVTNWLKRALPVLVNATPIQNLFTVWILVVGCTYAACLITGLQCTWVDIQQYAANTALFSHAVQALLKTDSDKLSLGLPTVTVTKPTTTNP